MYGSVIVGGKVARSMGGGGEPSQKIHGGISWMVDALGSCASQGVGTPHGSNPSMPKGAFHKPFPSSGMPGMKLEGSVQLSTSFVGRNSGIG